MIRCATEIALHLFFNFVKQCTGMPTLEPFQSFFKLSTKKRIFLVLGKKTSKIRTSVYLIQYIGLMYHTYTYLTNNIGFTVGIFKLYN